MKKTAFTFSALIVLTFGVAMAADSGGRELSLTEVWDLAVRHSPDVEASVGRQRAADEEIGAARAGYLPRAEFDVIDSAGFPGSSSLTGVGGLMGSPFRSGAAYGVSMTQTLVDFGRVANDVKSARGSEKSAEADTELAKYRVRLAITGIFFQCSLYATQLETWNAIEAEASQLLREIQRYVKTGQRSLVAQYLMQGQVEQARTARADLTERRETTLKLIHLRGGVPLGRSCPLLREEAASNVASADAPGSNPWVTRAEAQVTSAQARLQRVQAQNYPKLVGVASVGDMESARLVGKQDFAVAAGLIIPIFDGFRTTHEIAKARAELASHESELALAREDLHALAVELEGRTLAAGARVVHLHEEVELASAAFTSAKTRYFSFQGPLTDVLDALRNLERTRTDFNEALAQMSLARASLALLGPRETNSPEPK